MNAAIVIATLSLLLTAPAAAAAPVAVSAYAWTPASFVGAFASVDGDATHPARATAGVVGGPPGLEGAGTVADVRAPGVRAGVNTETGSACATGVQECPPDPGTG